DRGRRRRRGGCRGAAVRRRHALRPGSRSRDRRLAPPGAPRPARRGRRSPPHRPHRPADRPRRSPVTTTTTARTRTGLLLEDVDLVLGDGDSSVTALAAVSMAVAPGELVAVVGPSGAGKSSLLAVAGGLTRPDHGRVVVDDLDVVAATAAGRARYRRERVGFVFQSGNLIPALTAVDQLR